MSYSGTSIGIELIEYEGVTNGFTSNETLVVVRIDERPTYRCLLASVHHPDGFFT